MSGERNAHRAPARRRGTMGVLVAAVATLAAVGFPAGPGSAAESATPGTVVTVVGGGGGGSVSYGFSGDGGPATEAQLWQPRAIAFDSAGNAYIADALNHRVRKVDSSGVITTIAGTGDAGYGGDGGPATEAQLYNPHGVTVDSQGDVYIADSANHRIRRVDGSGVITTIAGDGTPGGDGEGGPAAQAQVKFPKALAVDAEDNLYISDSRNNRICRINRADGTITTVAGQIPAGFSGDGGDATRARLNKPNGIWVTASGLLYIADSDNHRIRVVDPDGTIRTVAGTGTAGSEGDGGPASAAQLNDPRGVLADEAGNVYIAEEFGHRVRRVDPSGKITTVAGTGTAGYSGDGGPATAAEFNNPRGLAFDPSGRLWLADMANNRIRSIT